MASLSQISKGLYRQILRMNSHLPLELKTLGNMYIKDEFRLHQQATTEQAIEFLQAWTQYMEYIQGQITRKQWDQLGVCLGDEELIAFNEKQIIQLHKLKQEISQI